MRRPAPTRIEPGSWDEHAQVIAPNHSDAAASGREPARAEPVADPPAGSPTVEPAERRGIRLPHHIVIVGGGAGGLELATRLGDRLGRRGKARITLVDCALHAHLEAAAARGRRGHAGPRRRRLDYLAQARWHHFKFTSAA